MQGQTLCSPLLCLTTCLRIILPPLKVFSLSALVLLFRLAVGLFPLLVLIFTHSTSAEGHRYTQRDENPHLTITLLPECVVLNRSLFPSLFFRLSFTGTLLSSETVSIQLFTIILSHLSVRAQCFKRYRCARRRERTNKCKSNQSFNVLTVWRHFVAYLINSGCMKSDKKTCQDHVNKWYYWQCFTIIGWSIEIIYWRQTENKSHVSILYCQNDFKKVFQFLKWCNVYDTLYFIMWTCVKVGNVQPLKPSFNTGAELFTGEKYFLSLHNQTWGKNISIPRLLLLW